MATKAIKIGMTEEKITEKHTLTEIDAKLIVGWAKMNARWEMEEREPDINVLRHEKCERIKKENWEAIIRLAQGIIERAEEEEIRNLTEYDD